ncbi:hypothetical protein [Streptomyces vastus]
MMARRAVDLLAGRIERSERNGRPEHAADGEEFVSSYSVVIRESAGG